MSRKVWTLVGAFLGALLTVGGHCNNENTVTGPLATATPAPTAAATVTATPAPPTGTATPPGPTSTPVPPTATFTPAPPTSTAVPATVTPAPPTATPAPGAPVITGIAGERAPLHPNDRVDIFGTNIYASPTVTLEAGGTIAATPPVTLTDGSSYLEVTLPGSTPAGTYNACVRTALGKACSTDTVTVVTP
jgi:hypothetical protein